MEIESTIPRGNSGSYRVVYRDSDTYAELEGLPVAGVHAYCFYKGKLAVVYSDKKGTWTPPGGGVEPGETVEEAITREVAEETNMRVLTQRMIGYQEIFENGGVTRQVRSMCTVEPMGDFISDPDGDITEIRLIDPAEYKQYFDWGIIGEHILNRAVQMRETPEASTGT